jgi:hypothetical protein
MYNSRSRKTLKKRRPYILSSAFKAAKLKGTEDRIATALHVNVTDVEIMRNPTLRPGTFKLRPGPFAHSFVMTVSPAGVNIFQAYGPRGYTLLQNMQDHSVGGTKQTFPLSIEEDAGDIWIDTFEKIAGEFIGKWTKEVNDAYKFCFEVDLVKLGCMKIGSQLDF